MFFGSSKDDGTTARATAKIKDEQQFPLGMTTRKQRQRQAEWVKEKGGRQ
jgi:hypothetical protein